MIVFLALFLTGSRTPNETAPANTASSNTIVSSTPAFQTKEADRYQATRTITTVTRAGRTEVTKSRSARDGDMRRHESGTLSKRVAYLDLPEGRLVLLIDDKVYADLADEIESPTTEDEEITPERLLHTDAGSTTYQNLGKEVVAGRNSSKYKTIVNSSNAGNVSHSETLIWIDESLNMPIRSETRSPDGTLVTMELSNVTIAINKGLFEVPDDYKKIAFTEIRKRLAAH